MFGAGRIAGRAECRGGPHCRGSEHREYAPKYRQLYDKRRRAHRGDLLRAQERARRDAVQEFLRAAKLERGCMDCGYAAHHAALEAVHCGTGKVLTLSIVKTLAAATSAPDRSPANPRTESTQLLDHRGV